MGKLCSAGSIRSQACPRLVYTTKPGLKTEGSSRLPAGIVRISGMPLVRASTEEPQAAQKPRPTRLPLSAVELVVARLAGELHGIRREREEARVAGAGLVLAVAALALAAEQRLGRDLVADRTTGAAAPIGRGHRWFLPAPATPRPAAPAPRPDNGRGGEPMPSSTARSPRRDPWAPCRAGCRRRPGCRARAHRPSSCGRRCRRRP